VVVPGSTATRRHAGCLEALARPHAASTSIVLVDDASTDARIAPLLAEFASRNPNATVLAPSATSDSSARETAGIGEAGGDVVILNSDAEVTAGWLEGLRRCAQATPRSASSARSPTHATILSLPGMTLLLKRADGSADVDAIGAAVAAASTRAYPRLPTAVGFCMLVTREVLDRCGLLDAVYGRGYGEENDLSMRALAAGFAIACADDVYVHHAGEASFGGVAGIDAEREANRSRLERRWPGYAPAVAAWGQANPLRVPIERANAEAERRAFPRRMRVLQVLHRYESRGGIEEHTRAIVEALKDEVTFDVAFPHPAPTGWNDFAVERTAPHLRIARMNPELRDPGIFVIGHAASIADPRVESAFGNLLAGGYDAVHFQSLVDWNTLRLPRMARAAGAAVALLPRPHARLRRLQHGARARGPAVRARRRAQRGSRLREVPALEERRGGHARAARDQRVHRRALRRGVRRGGRGPRAGVPVRIPRRAHAARVRRALRRQARGRGPWRARLPDRLRKPRSPHAARRRVGRFNGRKGGEVFIDAVRRLAGRPFSFEIWGQVRGASTRRRAPPASRCAAPTTPKTCRA
jgi:hypothetical protein